MCNNKGMKELSEHLRGARISQKAFAAMIGVDPSIVSKLLNGSARPGLELAVRIEDATGGAVPARSWVSKADDTNGEAA